MYIEFTPRDTSRHFIIVQNGVAHTFTEQRLRELAQGNINADQCTPELVSALALFLLDRTGSR